MAVPELDGLGLGVDFRELKGRLKAWVDANWDHAFLAAESDTALVEALRTVPGARLYLFPDANPSTEVLARELFGVAGRRSGTWCSGCGCGSRPPSTRSTCRTW